MWCNVGRHGTKGAWTGMARGTTGCDEGVMAATIQTTLARLAVWLAGRMERQREKHMLLSYPANLENLSNHTPKEGEQREANR